MYVYCYSNLGAIYAKVYERRRWEGGQAWEGGGGKETGCGEQGLKEKAGTRDEEQQGHGGIRGVYACNVMLSYTLYGGTYFPFSEILLCWVDIVSVTKQDCFQRILKSGEGFHDVY